MKKNKIKQLINNFLSKISPSYRKIIVCENILNRLNSKVEDLSLIYKDIDKNINKNIDIRFEDISKNWKHNFLSEKNNFFINLDGEIVDIDKYTRTKIQKYNCSIEKFFEKMRKYIVRSEIVIDIGCGIRPETFFEPSVHICIEPFDQYRKVIKPYFPNNSNVIFIKTDALNGIKGFDDDSVDTVFVMDVIEHLTKKDGLKLIKEADRVARKQVVIFTPLGFYPMFYKKTGDKDAWGLGGTDVQEHQSGWMPKDFDKTWDFYICKDCHESFLPDEKAKGKRYSAFMAIKTKKFKGFPVQKNTPEFVKELYNIRVNRGKIL